MGARAVGFFEHASIDAWISARVEQLHRRQGVTAPEVHKDPNTATELRPGARFGSRGLQMGRS